MKEGLLNGVENDKKYLGSWILNFKKDFLLSKGLASEAAISSKSLEI